MNDPLHVRRALLGDDDDAAAYRDMLNQYASDPLGQATPLADEVLDKVLTDLHRHACAVAFLAFWDVQPVGFATCFLGYSTFKAAPLLNIHDIAVRADFRRRGIARRLIDAIAHEAGKMGCCRLTLEVREDNPAATALYRSCGFDVSKPGGQPVAYNFMERPLPGNSA
jgi:ribosomal protein S18 acetylase RimI-like enzyme